MIRKCKEFIFCYLSETRSINAQPAFVTCPMLCFTNLCPEFQVSWVVEAHDKLQDAICAEGCIGSKSAHPTSRPKPVAM